MDNLEIELNDEQEKAVKTTQGPVLVLAGAGSGKTRVLVQRISYLCNDCNVMPYNILAVTFTNKAAQTMRDRLLRQSVIPMRGIWICTFHSMCARILRNHAKVLNFNNNYSIFDDGDAKRMIKSIMQDKNISIKTINPNVIRNKISNSKNMLITPDVFCKQAIDYIDKITGDIYKEYQTRLIRSNAMDFDDLLFNTYKLFSENSSILEIYSSKFHYILIDEYQDTNLAQYKISAMLAKKYRNIMVVGDDDQSIYSWRGADIRNILEFEKEYSDATTIKLEQNYRSTGVILDAANAVISNNLSRKSKNLFTEQQGGDKIMLYSASDERDEGRWIASELERLHSEGFSFNEMSIFYRANAQSRIIEDMLLRAGIPYNIIGGTKFFDRSEIRDVCAYLKVANNIYDDISAVRIINKPPRGIGKKTVESINNFAQLNNISFIEASRLYACDSSTSVSSATKVAKFLDLLDEITKCRGELKDIVEFIINKSGIIEYLKEKHDDESMARIENIHEFINVVSEYCDTHQEIEEEVISSDLNDEPEIILRAPGLSDFMEWLSLRTDLDSLGEDDSEKVNLMTIHSAKGLEFDIVFVCGMEESLFPHLNSLLEGNIEEERRLAYVAITRAKKKLFLTHAMTRHDYRETKANPRSRFVSEIPKELLKHVGIGSFGLKGTGWEKRGDRHSSFGSGQGEKMYGGNLHKKSREETKPYHSTVKKNLKDVLYEPGDRINHKIFGVGKVLEVKNDRLIIHFETLNKTKTLLKDYAPIVKL